MLADRVPTEFHLLDATTLRFQGAMEFPSEPTTKNGIVDPGPVPLEMLRIPGFVSEVMDLCLATAPYPNHVMAFCGAVALQAFLAGRKVRDPGDNRTNLYLLGLAHSSAGKDWPRKLNTRILFEIGAAGCLGERFTVRDARKGDCKADASHDSPAGRREQILELLRDSGKLRSASIASHLGCSLNTVKRELHALRLAGRIEFIGPNKTGTYQLMRR